MVDIALQKKTTKQLLQLLVSKGKAFIERPEFIPRDQNWKPSSILKKIHPLADCPKYHTLGFFSGSLFFFFPPLNLFYFHRLINNYFAKQECAAVTCASLIGRANNLSQVIVQKQKQTLTLEMKLKTFRKVSSNIGFRGSFGFFSVLLIWLVLKCCTIGTKLIFLMQYYGPVDMSH